MDKELGVSVDYSSNLRILPVIDPSDGTVSLTGYTIRKHTNESKPLESPTAQAGSAAARASSITSICVTPTQYPDTGLECVDVDDAGISRLRPVRVDDDCMLIQGWLTYLEPQTAGCAPDDALCSPSVYQGSVVRMGYSMDDGTPFVPVLASSSADGGGLFVMIGFIMYSLLLHV